MPKANYRLPTVVYGTLSLTLAMWCVAARAEEPVAVAELRGKVGQTCVVEFRVATVKKSERRATWFLSSAKNLHAEGSVAVAIREADMPNFEDAKASDFESRYLGRTVRLRGKVEEDEGQLLLFARAPDQLTLVNNDEKPAADAAATDAALTIANEAEPSVKLSLPLDKELPRQRVTVELDGKQVTYEGVLISALLERAKVRIGANARGPLVTRYLVLTAADGYRVVLSISEVDPYITDQTVLVAERRDDQPLPAAEAPLRLIVVGDKHYRRWIRQLVAIDVLRAPVKEADAKR